MFHVVQSFGGFVKQNKDELRICVCKQWVANWEVSRVCTYASPKKQNRCHSSYWISQTLVGIVLLVI